MRHESADAGLVTHYCCKMSEQTGVRMSRANKILKVTAAPKDPYITSLLENISEGKRLLTLSTGETIFAQGDRADAIFFIDSGKVKISVVSAGGKEAVL